MQHSLFAPYARLEDGWQRNVLFSWSALGVLTEVKADIECPPGVPHAAGPVIAGMPNLHSHAFQRAMAGLTEYRATAADSFWSWRDLMYRFATRIAPDDVEAISRWLYIEMLKAGYTSVCEFHYVHHAPHGKRYTDVGEIASRTLTAANEVGIGMTLLPVLYQYGGFNEVPPNAGQARFLQSPDELLQMIASLRRAFPESTMRRYGVAPHSLRAVTPESLARVVAGLHQVLPNAPVHIHIAEQEAEVTACLAAFGQRPVEWLLANAAVDEHWCLVHATHVNEAEVAAMAKSGAVVGLCLTTEANLGDGIFPTPAYLSHNGHFGLGSDSHIAVDWRSELRLMEYGQRLSLRQRNVLASEDNPYVADRLFDAAVAGGSRATGRPVGQLTPGHSADLLVLDAQHDAIACGHPDTWLSGIVFAEHGSNPIRHVMVAGKWVVEDGQHRDESAARDAYQRTVKGLLA